MTVLTRTPRAESLRPGRGRRFRAGPATVVAVVVLVVALLVALLAPVIAPTDPNAGDLLNAFAPPGPEHWLGTDATGRDIFSRLVHGARTSLLGPALIVLIALAVSVPLALVTAWRGGWVAFGVTRVLDVLFAIPGLLLAILAVSVFGPGLGAAVIALGIAYVPYVARLAVTAAEQQHRLPYVQVLTVQGISATRIMGVHVLRNMGPLLLGQATITFAYALIDLAALSFLGLGVQAPQSDWGVMVSDRDAVLQGHPLQVVVASIAIVATVLALFVLGSRLSGETPSRFRRRRTGGSRA